MMDQFVVWQMHGVRYICLRDPMNPHWLTRLKRLVYPATVTQLTKGNYHD